MLVYQLTNFRKTLDEVSNFPGIEFAYAVFKNKQLIDNKLMEVDFIKEVNPMVVEYEKKRIALCEEFAKKDDVGSPIVEKDLYVIEDKENFKMKMDEILEQYRPYVEERQNQVELFNQKMNSEVDLPFVKIKKEQLPPQINTARDLEKLSFMIE